MTNEELNECREAFEADVLRFGFITSDDLKRDKDGDYIVYETSSRWGLYQAAWSRRAAPDAPVVGQQASELPPLLPNRPTGDAATEANQRTHAAFSGAAVRAAPAIPAQEITDLLLKALAREVSIKILNYSWSDTYAGDGLFEIGGYRVTIFNDCMEIDYVSDALAPDGRECEFEEWCDAGGDPVGLLSDHQISCLEALFESLMPDIALEVINV